MMSIANGFIADYRRMGGVLLTSAGIFILSLFSSLAPASPSCQGLPEEVRKDMESQIYYMEELLDHKESWIEQNKFEVDSYDHYQSDLKTLRVSLKKIERSLEQVEDCTDLTSPSGALLSSTTTVYDEQSEDSQAVIQLKRNLLSFQNEAKFLRVYDFQWAEKFIIKSDYLLSRVNSPAFNTNTQNEDSVKNPVEPASGTVPNPVPSDRDSMVVL